jgi:hypothetical protein
MSHTGINDPMKDDDEDQKVRAGSFSDIGGAERNLERLIKSSKCDFCRDDQRAGHGQCSSSFLCKKGCQRIFCIEHDGRYQCDYESVQYNVCHECAPQFNRVIKCVTWSVFSLFIILVLVCLILVFVFHVFVNES